jgi:beta-glucosidase
MKPKKKLPFLWGSATSSHQVEGNNRANDWWAWEQAGKLKEPSNLACDHYRRFREDFQLVSDLEHNAHRFSLEWSRFEPEENHWDEEAFRHYEEVFKELARRNIEPIVTLHHFTNPQWFADKGGWVAEDTTRYFTRYVDRVVKRYSRYVRFWITINEPLIYLYHSFFAGLWPPGVQSYDDSMKVFRHQMAAHAESYQIIHQHYESDLARQVWVSIAMHISRFTPCRAGSWLDRWTVMLRNWFANELFLDAAIKGFLFFPGIFCEFLPAKSTLDFIGLNYYTRDFIRFAGLGKEQFIGDICDKNHHMGEIRERNMMGWEVHADGLYQILKRLKRYKLPIMITENGIATEDDAQRVKFIENHLSAVSRARQEGSPVMGYLYWSLLDNFEWAHGFGPRFGIIEMDYGTQERKVRRSAQVLSALCRNIESQG